MWLACRLTALAWNYEYMMLFGVTMHNVRQTDCNSLLFCCVNRVEKAVYEFLYTTVVKFLKTTQLHGFAIELNRVHYYEH